MRRRLLTLLFLAALAAVTMAVPLWAALRSEHGLIAGSSIHLNRTQSPVRPLAEAATLAFTGAVLIGLASAVRHTS